MPLRLPIGTSNFKKLREQGYYFVDKTLFIKDALTADGEVLLFTRPRRFGKTINMSILYYFLTNKAEHIDSTLFANTNIAKDQKFCRQYQNKYPVIFLTFKDVKKAAPEDAYAEIATIFSDLYSSYRDVLESDKIYPHERKIIDSIINETAAKNHLEGALKKLCEYIFTVTGKLPYVLIDEYDTPIQSSYINNYYKEMVESMRSILGKGLKDNTPLAKGIVTGITKVSQESIFSGFNNPKVHSMLGSQFGEYFGFTELEVKQLLQHDGHEESLNEIKSWYNGYQIGKKTIYNPWSIINCIDEEYKYDTYWINTSENALIKRQLESNKAVIRSSFVDLLQGKTIDRAISENLVFPDLAHDEEAIWSLLHSSGYLNISSTKRVGRRNVASLSIPNEEVKLIYDTIVEKWFSYSDVSSLKDYDVFINSLTLGDITLFKQKLSTFLIESGSYFDFTKKSAEKIFHSFMLGLVVGLREAYIINSNVKSGLGRYDLILLPKDNKKQGIILEFKTAKKHELLKSSAEEGLQQIKDQKYTTTFSQHNIKTILLLGIAFYGKELEMVSELIET